MGLIVSFDMSTKRFNSRVQIDNILKSLIIAIQSISSVTDFAYFL